MSESYDALLLVSFGGPEGPDDVMPFLENVLRGKNVPRARMLEVAEHYQHFDGVSPINGQNRALIDALRAELEVRGPNLPIYWGNRNWHPLLRDTLLEMKDAGIRNCLAFVTSAFSSYSGCRQYREDIQRAREEIGPGAPQVHKLRGFFNHPKFIQTVAFRLAEALKQVPAERRSTARVVFTAHSIPLGMASGCQYVDQLQEACRLVAMQVGSHDWQLAYQSRSGPPNQPWLEPDIGEALAELAADGCTQDVVVVPIGFISDHMEVLFDLDTEARELCDSRGLHMVRAATAGTHPEFVSMIGSLLRERTADEARLSSGTLDILPDICPDDCCLSGRPAAGPPAGRPARRPG